MKSKTQVPNRPPEAIEAEDEISVDEMNARMREEDWARLKAGTVTPEELQEENSVLPKNIRSFKILRLGS